MATLSDLRARDEETRAIVLEPEAQQFADAASHPPFPAQLGYVKGRAAFVNLQSGPVSKRDAVVVDTAVDAGDWGLVPVRIVRPPNTSEPLPVILYLHAGWVFGDATTHDRLVRQLASDVHAAVVFPIFSLSPEAKYPVALNQIYAVAEWISTSGGGQGFDPNRIAVAGDSAGGNMATVMTMWAKDRSGPPFLHQLLFYPTLAAEFNTPSYQQFATGFHVRRDHMEWLWDQYLPDHERRAEVSASPLHATTDQLRGLAPATIITPEADVVRDDGEIYAAKLRTAGVPVSAVRYTGTIHDFMVLDALRNTNSARAAVAQVVSVLHHAFHNRDPR